MRERERERDSKRIRRGRGNRWSHEGARGGLFIGERRSTEAPCAGEVVAVAAGHGGSRERV